MNIRFQSLNRMGLDNFGKVKKEPLVRICTELENL